MFKSGDKPGQGKYKCKKCGKEISIENDSQELPLCPQCGHDKWDKIG